MTRTHLHHHFNAIGERGRRPGRGGTLVAWSLLLALVGVGTAGADPQDPGGIGGSDVYLFGMVRRNYDSNLYRLPENAAAFGISLPAGYSRGDRYTETGGGVDADIEPFRQPITLHFVANRVDYDHNSYLNYTAADGDAIWNWRSGNTLSGQVSAAYKRVLADFVNNRLFVRDVVDHSTQAANLKWGIGADYAVLLAADTSTTHQGVHIKQYEDNRTNSGSVAFQYSVHQTLTVGLKYKEARADYDDEFYSFDNKSAEATLSYLLSLKTQVDADFGWQRRDYANDRIANFSGTVGHLSIVWQATPVTSVTLLGFRDLNAYLNNETDYYVTNGETLSLSWHPVYTLLVSLNATHERQDYTGLGVGILSTIRQDRVNNTSVSVKWTPRRWLELTLGGGIEHRESTNGYFNYGDKMLNGTFRLIW